MMADLLSLNWQLFEDLNQQAGRSPLLDKLMIFGANDALFVLPLLLLALWFGLSHWSPLIRSGADSSLAAVRQLGQQIALLAVVAVAVALALNVAIGNLFYEPRPFVSHPLQDHKLIAHPADASFPSDHEAVAGAITAMLVIYMLLLLFGKLAARLRVAAVRRLAVTVAVISVIALLFIGVARVYVGVHYPGDILGGMACGVIGALVALALRPLVEPVLGPMVRLAERLRVA